MTRDNETIELKPCPFCGGEAGIKETLMPPVMGRSERSVISAEVRHFCPRVEGQPHGMSVKQLGRDRNSAIKAWNTRADRQAPQVDVEKNMSDAVHAFIDDRALPADTPTKELMYHFGIHLAAQGHLSPNPEVCLSNNAENNKQTDLSVKCERQDEWMPIDEFKFMALLQEVLRQHLQEPSPIHSKSIIDVQKKKEASIIRLWDYISTPPKTGDEHE